MVYILPGLATCSGRTPPLASSSWVGSSKSVALKGIQQVKKMDGFDFGFNIIWSFWHKTVCIYYPLCNVFGHPTAQPIYMLLLESLQLSLDSLRKSGFWSLSNSVQKKIPDYVINNGSKCIRVVENLRTNICDKDS